jgi:hypothetical protein
MAGYGFASYPPYGLRRLRAVTDYPTGKSAVLFSRSAVNPGKKYSAFQK